MIWAVPISACADGKLAEMTEQVGKMVEHLRSKSTQSNHLTRWITLYKVFIINASLQVNKIETVRILRARPAFYPIVRDRYAGAAAPVVDTGAHVLPGHGHGRHQRGVFAAAAAAAAASGGHRGRYGGVTDLEKSGGN